MSAEDAAAEQFIAACGDAGRLIARAFLDFHTAVQAAMPAAVPVALPLVPEPEKLGLSTPERDAVIRARYEAEGCGDDLLATLNAMPGLPMNKQQLASRAVAKLGLHVVDRGAVVKAAIAAHRRKQDDGDSLYTAARAQLLGQLWAVPGRQNQGGIIVRLNEQPGRPFTRWQQVIDYAKYLQLRRPAHDADGLAADAPNPPPPLPPMPPEVAVEPVYRLYTPARDALIAARYGTEGASDALVAALNELPGQRVKNRQQIMNRANQMGIKSGAKQRRPAVESAPARPAVTPAPWTPPARPAPVVVSQSPRAPVAPVRFAAPGPVLKPQGIAAPLPPSPQQRQREADAAAIAAHIASKGVTRCPTAVLEATTASVPAEDRSALRRHADALQSAKDAEITARVDRVKANKAAKMQNSITRLQGSR